LHPRLLIARERQCFKYRLSGCTVGGTEQRQNALRKGAARLVSHIWWPTIFIFLTQGFGFALLCFAWLACLALTLTFALVVLRLRCVLLFALRCSLLCGLALLYSAVWLCHLPSAPLLRRSRSSAEASIVFCQYSNFPLLQTLSLVASSPNHRPLSENR
jgi:hypothetical protein